MNADVVGYSQLMAQDAQGTIDGLLSCVALICGLVHEAGGRVIDAVGDNLSAEFESESAALYCALAVQRALAERQYEVGSTPIRVRIGLHTGDVLRAAKRRFGNVVNIAARLQTAALPDGVLVSDELVEGLSPELRDLLVEVGPRQFKNIPYSVGTFAARV